MRVACLKHGKSDINSLRKTPQAKVPDWLAKRYLRNINLYL